MDVNTLTIDEITGQWQASRGRPPVLLDAQLRAHLWPHQQLPGKMLYSDTHQYFWLLGCRKHVKMMTIQAVVRQMSKERPIKQAHLSGRMNECERCFGHTTDVHRSTWELCAWRQLEVVLEQPRVHQYMRLKGQSIGLWGGDLGFLVESKVLGGKRGACDVYIPVLNLLIQIDGEHHDKVDQLVVDSRFDSDAKQQGRRLLRLHHSDANNFCAYIYYAVEMCIRSPAASWVLYTRHHPHFTTPTVK
jgi:hypothetical protein